MSRQSIFRTLYAVTAMQCVYGCLGTAAPSANAVGTSDSASALSSQVYRLISVNSGMAIDVPYGSKDNVQVQQWPFWNGPMQLWNMVPEADGTYAIVNVNSGKTLDVLNVSKDPGAIVIQFNNWQGANQRWTPKQLADGSYQLVNYNSGLCLDVYGISKTQGALLQQFTCWNSPNQHWLIQPVDGNGNPTGNGLQSSTPSSSGSVGGGAFVQATSLQVTSGSAPAVPCLDPTRGGADQSVAPAQRTTLTTSLAAGGSFAVGLRVSTPDTAVNAHLLLNGQDVSGPLTLASTGSSDSYQTVYVRNIITGAQAGTLSVVFDSAGATLHGISVETSDVVQMITRPGQLYFGGISFMSDLMQYDQWPYVRANVDGFTFHSAAWGTAQMPQAASLVQTLPSTVHYAGELGALTTSSVPVSPTAGTDMGNQWATWAAMMRDVGHVPMDHLNINFDSIGFVQSLAQSTPAASTAQITQTALTQELNYETAIHATVPGMPLVMIYANPIFTTWKGQPGIVNDGHGGQYFNPLTDVNNNPIYVNGQTVNMSFDSFDFLEPYYQQAQNSYGYETDSPSNYLTFYGPESDPRNVTYRNKIYNYERWLHGLNKTHTQIINSDQQGGSASSDPTAQAQWDQTYYTVCTQGIEVYQRNGGRADIYNAESWYGGPYVVVPETAPYSYTNLIMHLLKYLKGAGETLTLTAANGQRTPAVTIAAGGTQSVALTLTNGGDVEAMPMVAATETGDQGIAVTYQDNANNDITQLMARTTGYVLGNTLAAGASQQIQVTVVCPAGVSANRTITLAAFWNPQDPTQKPRDTTTLAIHCGP